ncbi:MAG: hypothetical protein Q9194_002486 [Teloschistes cf. exilis]
MGEVSPEETTEPEDDLTQAADELAAIYIAADKYQLPDLRTLIVGKLTTHIDNQRPPIEFLQTARKTYTYMPEFEGIFRTFFKETATELPKPSEMAQNLSHIFNDCIKDGGIMAIDMFAALCAKNAAEVNSARKQGGRELSASIEFRTLTINLPDDEIEVFQAIIQYLYAGDFTELGSTAILDANEGIGKEDLATMYITADKYQNQDLKSLVVKKFAAVIDTKERPVEFLEIARRIYTSVPDSDEAYRSFFKSSFGTAASIEPKSTDLRQMIEHCIYNGGKLALDMVEVRETELRKKSTVHSDALVQQFMALSDILAQTQA